MTFRLPPRLAWVEDETSPEPALYLALVPDGVPLVLEEPARTIWFAAVGGATTAEMVAAVAEATMAPRDQIASDVERFLQDLVNRGVLEVDT